MRVMWFTNMPMPAVDRRCGRLTRGTGTWMTALLEVLAQRGALQLAVASAWPGSADDYFQEQGVDYFVIGLPARHGGAWRAQTPPLRQCAEIARQWRPDLVHVHGTEQFFGLLSVRGLIDFPTIIGIQGILREYLRKCNYFGTLSLLDIARSVTQRGLLTGHGLLWARRDLGRHATQEDEIIKGNTFFIGQTLWDLSHVEAANPDAIYYRVGRVLREPFGQFAWDIRRCRRNSVIFTNAGSPSRGVETLLEAVAILQRDVPDISLRIGGALNPRDGYARLLRRRISQSPIAPRVELLDYMEAPTMAKALADSHLFVIPSHVENESLSLCEAMRVGMPCVATYAGGLASTLVGERSGLQFPAGDSAVLAHQMRRLFEDDELAVRLGAAAGLLAKERHDPERVVAELLHAYEDVLCRCRQARKVKAEFSCE